MDEDKIIAAILATGLIRSTTWPTTGIANEPTAHTAILAYQQCLQLLQATPKEAVRR